MRGLMQAKASAGYLANCLWLMLPPLAICGLLGGYLPTAFHAETFWHDIPVWIAWPESLSRFLFIALTALMPLSTVTPRQQRGAAIYIVGIVLYGLAWWPLIAAPDSIWSATLLGFAAPAYTPIVWLVGIGLIGIRTEQTVSRWVAWLYAASALVFLICHNGHALLIYSRHM